MAWKLTDNFKGHFRRIGLPGRKGPNHPKWKGGRMIDSDGYVRIWVPDHKWLRKGYLGEHIVVMENHIGRRILITECVHHKDHNRQNNALKNLELISKSEHSKRHRADDKHRIVKGEHGRFVSWDKCGSTQRA